MGVMMRSGCYGFEGGYDAAVIELKSRVCLFLDIDKVRTVAQEKAAVAHEWAHIKTDTLHKHDAPVELIQWGETKAHRKEIERLLPWNDLRAAVLSGATELCQLAELFCVPEYLVSDALAYYQGPCGFVI